jgi:uncharacterized protein (TIGR00369 family)
VTQRQLLILVDGPRAWRQAFFMAEMQENWRAVMAAAMGKTPFIVSLGGEIAELGGGKVRMRLPYSQKLVGDPDTGVVHGGVITAMLDHCCGLAIGGALRAPASYVTLDLRIDYMKPARPKADIIFEAQCSKITHEIIFARGLAFQDDRQEPIARSTGTFMFSRPQGTGS